MVKVELGETIQIGSGCTGDMLKGVAMMAEALQCQGVTAKYSFSSVNHALTFDDYSVEVGAVCLVYGKSAIIEGKR